jgi:hypothetical protein
MNVTNNNVGGYNTGYKIWEFTAFNDECTENVAVMRSTWWDETNGPAT